MRKIKEKVLVLNDDKKDHLLSLCACGIFGLTLLASMIH